MLALLTERDLLIERHKIVTVALEESRSKGERYGFSLRDVKYARHVNTNALQKQADDISAHLRKINLKIQAANWHIELI